MMWAGGCLCGAVRYQSTTAPTYASYCHCTMCQKASGAPFMGFVEVAPDAMDWVGDAPQIYQSSPGVIRRFCGTCGSQQSFEAEGVVFVTLGSLDTPDQVAVQCHTYVASRLPGITLADGLPEFPGPAGGKGGRPLG